MGTDAGMPGHAAPGWYGKLSTLGDFAGRRLPASVQQALDQWLSDVLDGSRAQLGEAWLQHYLGAPLQRFVLGPGVVGAPWWFGALMPSCDNVGRYFPLVVLQARATPPADGAGLDHLGRWWQRAAEALLETLADEVDVERFDRALADLPPWPAAREAAGWMLPWPDQATPAAAAGVLRLPAECEPAALVQGLAVGEWARRLHGHSLWWSWRPQGGPSACRVVPGLPSAGVFAAMLEPGG